MCQASSVSNPISNVGALISVGVPYKLFAEVLWAVV